MTTELRSLFSSIGWMVFDDDQAEQHIMRAQAMISSGEGSPRQLELAASILAAAGVKPEPAPQEEEVQAMVKAKSIEDAEAEKLWALAEQAVAAKLKLGSDRVDEIVQYCRRFRVDLSACLAAEIARVEALPDKKTARGASSRH